MTVPNYQTFMYPLLKICEDQKEHTLQEAYQHLSDLFQLTPEDKAETIPSGRQPVYQNRISWASTYLKKAGLIRSVKRGTFIITDRGKGVLQDLNVSQLDNKYLQRYNEFLEFQNKKVKDTSLSTDGDHLALTPSEQLDESYRIIQRQVSDELLERVKSCTPEFFEKLVVDLLVAMGYGGSIQDAGRAIGRSGDEGIDGIIKEDVLGLDMIYVQAKRWENVVGRPEIQKFAGSLEGQRAKKGVFITTSDFTDWAQEYVNRIEKKIILINGNELAEYMFKYDIGVSKVTQYILKKVDLDYFEE